MYADGSESDTKGSYEIFRAEGDALFKQGNFKKAIESYSTALDFRQADKAVLVCLSKCYLQLGDSTIALDNAEAALAEDVDYHKGIFAKAEALYSKGEFELSLVFYHRGNKLRPELQEFRLGIQKAQEAIDNAVGSPAKVKLTKEGDLSFFAKQDEKAKKKKMAYTYKPASQTADRRRRTPKAEENNKAVRTLLGELYGDKQFLEKILRETNTDTKNGQAIYDLACNGLNYLDTRTDFWRQQKPMYARRRDVSNRSKKGFKGTQDQYVMSELEQLDEELAQGQFEASLKRGQKCLKHVSELSIKDLPNKPLLQANLHSCIGNSLLELGQYDRALESHQKDLDLANDHESDEAKSRAYDNLGRVYARSGQYTNAIKIWEVKIQFNKHSLESAWLHHELGRCYLETGQNGKALENAEKAVTFADEANDNMWRLNAGVLLAQSQSKSGQHSAALDSFKTSLDLASALNDEGAVKALRKAIDEENAKLAVDEGSREGSGKSERGDPPTATEDPAPAEEAPNAEEPAKEKGEAS